MSSQGKVRPWSQSEIERFKEMYEGDWTLREMCEELSCSEDNKYKDLAKNFLIKWRKINCSSQSFRSLKTEAK